LPPPGQGARSCFVPARIVFRSGRPASTMKSTMSSPRANPSCASGIRFACCEYRHCRKISTSTHGIRPMLAQGETGRYLGHHTTVRSVAGAIQSLPNTQQGAHRSGWRKPSENGARGALGEWRSSQGKGCGRSGWHCRGPDRRRGGVPEAGNLAVQLIW
jgi:hypothetical protein